LNRLILASASPQRAALLKQIGLDFQAIKSDYCEPIIHDADQVERVALAKARNIGARFPDDLILGADTIVICAGKVLGKPRDEREAREMLMSLSDKVHKVVTGVALVQGTREISAREETLVWLRKIDEKEINAYVNSGEPFDKAGSYAVQGKGAVFVKKVEGCFFNVVGLPLARTVDLLNKWGFSIW